MADQEMNQESEKFLDKVKTVVVGPTVSVAIFPAQLVYHKGIPCVAQKIVDGVKHVYGKNDDGGEAKSTEQELSMRFERDPENKQDGEDEHSHINKKQDAQNNSVDRTEEKKEDTASNTPAKEAQAPEQRQTLTRKPINKSDNKKNTAGENSEQKTAKQQPVEIPAKRPETQPRGQSLNKPISQPQSAQQNAQNNTGLNTTTITAPRQTKTKPAWIDSAHKPAENNKTGPGKLSGGTKNSIPDKKPTAPPRTSSLRNTSTTIAKRSDTHRVPTKPDSTSIKKASTKTSVNNSFNKKPDAKRIKQASNKISALNSKNRITSNSPNRINSDGKSKGDLKQKNRQPDAGKVARLTALKNSLSEENDSNENGDRGNKGAKKGGAKRQRMKKGGSQKDAKGLLKEKKDAKSLKSKSKSKSKGKAKLSKKKTKSLLKSGAKKSGKYIWNTGKNIVKEKLTAVKDAIDFSDGGDAKDNPAAKVARKLAAMAAVKSATIAVKTVQLVVQLVMKIIQMIIKLIVTIIKTVIKQLIASIVPGIGTVFSIISMITTMATVISVMTWFVGCDGSDEGVYADQIIPEDIEKMIDARGELTAKEEETIRFFLGNVGKSDLKNQREKDGKKFDDAALVYLYAEKMGYSDMVDGTLQEQYEQMKTQGTCIYPTPDGESVPGGINSETAPVIGLRPGDIIYYGDEVNGIHHAAIFSGDGECFEINQETGEPMVDPIRVEDGVDVQIYRPPYPSQ
ncbi:MAG: hypothetical protein K5769_07085 [Pseudobutyrivibrio sp.]|nr:hypothetical protein [Pseudobutyrivibrio sp.]